jgi:hypothetical protein
MKPLSLALIAVLVSSLPVLAQTEPGPSKAEFEKLKAESAANAARIRELQAQLDQARSLAAKMEDELLTELRKAETAAKAKAFLGPLVPPAPSAVAPGALHYEGVKISKGKLLGKLTAIADEIGLVVLSIGSVDGVALGDEFSVTRNGQFVAKIAIDRVDRKWSAGKVVEKRESPRVADDVILTTSKVLDPLTVPLPAPAPIPLSRTAAGELQSLRKELDEVRAQVRQLSDRLVPSWQGAGVSVEETPEELRAHLGILHGLLVRRVREGSSAERAGLMANDVVPDLLEAQLLDAIDRGLPVVIVRQGQRLRLAGAKGK